MRRCDGYIADERGTVRLMLCSGILETSNLPGNTGSECGGSRPAHRTEYVGAVLSAEVERARDDTAQGNRLKGDDRLGGIGIARGDRDRHAMSRFREGEAKPDLHGRTSLRNPTPLMRCWAGHSAYVSRSGT